MAEIKKQIRSDIDFEMRDKYKDSIDLEKRRIDAARAVGVAFGNGQQPQTTNLNLAPLTVRNLLATTC